MTCELTEAEKEAMATLRNVPLQGNLFQAERLRKAAIHHGEAAVPFLVHALEAGSVPIKAAAMQALGQIDLTAATERALALVASPHEDSEVRAIAAAILAYASTDQALNVLLHAIYESPLVGDAALAALEGHTKRSATRRLHQELRRLINEIATSYYDTSPHAHPGRRLRAADGLIRLLARRSFQEMEVELLVWWRTHPNAQIQSWAGAALLLGGVENACLVLSEGVPGTNEGTPSETGELDGPARHLIAKAAMIVLGKPSPEAFERLAPYFCEQSLAGWFGSKRAEVLLLLLLAQVGYNPTSWLSAWADELGRSGVRPDQRWRSVPEGIPRRFRSLRILAEQLSAAVDG